LKSALALALAIAAGCSSSSAQSLPHVPAGFTIERIANISAARELAFAPNGDLFAGTMGADVFIVPNAEGKPDPPRVFASVDSAPAAGVALANDKLYIGAQFAVYEVDYRTGDRHARKAPRRIASVRTSGVSSDHVTTSVTVAAGKLYASIGSSCNVCDPEVDNTRATIQRIENGKLIAQAVHIRNAIALTANPDTQTLWAGVAGQDELSQGHPYEIFDAVTARRDVSDYGWPYCYENRRPIGGHSCDRVVVPRVVFPAYVTPIGAAFYPVFMQGSHAFPARYRGGAFVTVHGSWHRPLQPPAVLFIPMHGDGPQHAVNWNDPSAQSREFVGGYQDAAGNRSGRPTGVAVGPRGDLFVADDQSGNIYRIRVK